MRKVFGKIVFFNLGLVLVMLFNTSIVFAHSISGTLNSSNTKVTVHQTISGSGKITTYISCYEVTSLNQKHLFTDTSTVYSGGSRTVTFNSHSGYRFKLNVNNEPGRVWVKLGSTTLASANISY